MPLSGLAAGERLVAVTRRPRNNLLYGLGYNPGSGTVQLYIVSPSLGQVRSVSEGAARAFTSDRVGVDGNTTFAMDVNPETDRIRVITSNGDNFRINPHNGALIDGDLGGASGSVSGTNKDGPINGLSAQILGLAHTNTAVITSNTTLYTIDAANDSIYIQNPAVLGTQTSALSLSNDIQSVFGFDIEFGVNSSSSDAPLTSGKAIVGVFSGGVPRIGALNLVTGELATSVVPPSTLSSPISLALTANQSGSYPVMLLGANGQSIIRTSSQRLGTASPLIISDVVAGETIVAIDFSPGTGRLMGLGVNPTNDTATLYSIDLVSGAASAQGTAGQVLFVDSSGARVDFPVGARWDIDINPRVDRVRVVTSTGLNFRIIPSSGAPQDGDSGVAGINPDGFLHEAALAADGVAFTNNSLGTSMTSQYALDATTSALYLTSNPDRGVMQFVAPITTPSGAPLSFSRVAGFIYPTMCERIAPTGRLFQAERPPFW
jgi:hypothetical protein